MPPWPLILDALLYTVLPALGLAAAVTGVVVLLGGERGKHGPLVRLLGPRRARACARLYLRESLTLIAQAASPWNRLPWAALAALWVGRVARQPGLQAGAGWLLRAAAAVLISWIIIPADTRHESDWLAPAFAATVFALWAILVAPGCRAVADVSAVPTCLAIVLLTAGAVLVHAGTARLMEATVVLASALAGIGAIAWWARCQTWAVFTFKGRGPAPWLLADGPAGDFQRTPLVHFRAAGTRPAAPGRSVAAEPVARYTPTNTSLFLDAALDGAAACRRLILGPGSGSS